MLKSRYLDIIWLLIKTPMTAEMLYRASKNFRIPYTNIGNLRNDVLYLHGQGFIGRQKVPSVSRGQKEYLYYPAKKAKHLPPFSDLGLPEAAFKGFSETTGIFQEAGFGINGILDLFRVDFAWRLNNFRSGDNFNVVFSIVDF